MDSACRQAIRKSEKSGITIEHAAPEGFAEEFYGHLQDVFAKQDMRPTYRIERVRQLIEHVYPSGDLLLARVRDPEGRSIATGIYPGFRGFSLFWGNGSLRPYQIHRPNEALHSYAMRHFKRRGISLHDWGGRATYKSKYGVSTFSVVAFRRSRFGVISMRGILRRRSTTTRATCGAPGTRQRSTRTDRARSGATGRILVA